MTYHYPKGTNVEIKKNTLSEIDVALRRSIFAVIKDKATELAGPHTDDELIREALNGTLILHVNRRDEIIGIVVMPELIFRRFGVMKQGDRVIKLGEMTAEAWGRMRL